MSHQSANPLWLCRVGGHSRDRGRELELHGIRGVSRHRPGPVRLPRDVLHLNLVFVRTCPRDFLCVGVSRREAVILFGWHSNRISFVCTSNTYSVLGPPILAMFEALFSSSSSWYLAVSLDFVTVSDCTHQLVLVDWFVDLSPDALSFLSTALSCQTRTR